MHIFIAVLKLLPQASHFEYHVLYKSETFQFDTFWPKSQDPMHIFIAVLKPLPQACHFEYHVLYKSETFFFTTKGVFCNFQPINGGSEKFQNQKIFFPLSLKP